MSKKTNTEKLLNELSKRGSMTRGQMVQFLVRKSSIDSDPFAVANNGGYNALLYGTTTRTGVLERFCRQKTDGSYRLAKKTFSAPFTSTRTEPRRLTKITRRGLSDQD